MLTISFLLFILGATLIIYGIIKYYNPTLPSCLTCKYGHIVYRKDRPFSSDPDTDYALYCCLKHDIISTPLYPSEVLHRECNYICTDYTCEVTKIKKLSDEKIIKMGRLDELMHKKIKHSKILIIACGVCGCMLITISLILFIIYGVIK